MYYIFTVEGNIGSGKSTLIKLLRNQFLSITENNVPIIYLAEPVSDWKNIIDKKGKNIIEKYYENQNKYAFSFQMMAYISRIHQIKKTINNNNKCIIICERSVYTDKEVFAKMLFDANKIEDVEYQIYLKWFNEFIIDIPISGIIYVKTPVQKSYERIQFRNRKGEENINIEYLQSCHNYHEKWLQNETIPILKLRGDKEFLTKLPENWLLLIETFIKNLSYDLFSNNSNYITNIKNYAYC